jgi:hypothetical protein
MGQNEGREGWEKMEIKNRKLRSENAKIGLENHKKMGRKSKKWGGASRVGWGGAGKMRRKRIINKRK